MTKNAQQMKKIAEKSTKPAERHLAMLKAQRDRDTLKMMDYCKPTEREQEIFKALLIKDSVKMIEFGIESEARVYGQNVYECRIPQFIAEEVTAELKDRGYQLSSVTPSCEDMNTEEIIIRW